MESDMATSLLKCFGTPHQLGQVRLVRVARLARMDDRYLATLRHRDQSRVGADHDVRDMCLLVLIVRRVGGNFCSGSSSAGSPWSLWSPMITRDSNGRSPRSCPRRTGSDVAYTSYLGKIKMIYIDPPFNAGNNFNLPRQLHRIPANVP